MKRFATTVAICAALMVGVGTYAKDFVWDGAADTEWINNNWDVANFPGGADRTFDRVIILDKNAGGDITVLFSGSSGDTSLDPSLDDRMISVLLIKPVDDKITFNQTGDDLHIGYLILEPPAVSGDDVLVDLDAGEMHVGDLDIRSNASVGTVTIDMATNIRMTVAGRTHLTGLLTVILGTDTVLDLGAFEISSGKLTSTS